MPTQAKKSGGVENKPPIGPVLGVGGFDAHYLIEGSSGAQVDGIPGQREALGLRANTGPSTVITDMGVYGFVNGEMVLKSIHAGIGVTVEKVKAEVEWDLKVDSSLKETAPPTIEEIEILRHKVDPTHIWVGGKRDYPKSFG